MDPNVHTAASSDGGVEPLIWIIVREKAYIDMFEEALHRHEVFRRHRFFSSCGEAVALLRENHQPRVILVDICDACNKKLEAIAQMRAHCPSAHILVLASGDDEDTIVHAICAGATGYLLRESARDRIVTAIQDILNGGTPMEPIVAHKVLSIVSHLAHQKHNYCLTEREMDILRLIADGRAKKEIADALFISFFTVDTHLKNIYEKMHVHSQGAAISKAYKERLLYMI